MTLKATAFGAKVDKADSDARRGTRRCPAEGPRDHLIGERKVSEPVVKVVDCSPISIRVRTAISNQGTVRVPTPCPFQQERERRMSTPKPPAPVVVEVPAPWKPEPRFYRWFPGASESECMPVF